MSFAIKKETVFKAVIEGKEYTLDETQLSDKLVKIKERIVELRNERDKITGVLQEFESFEIAIEKEMGIAPEVKKRRYKEASVETISEVKSTIYSQPDKEWSATELATKLGYGKSAIHYAARQLASSRMIFSSRVRAKNPSGRGSHFEFRYKKRSGAPAVSPPIRPIQGWVEHGSNVDLSALEEAERKDREARREEG
jgi:hypothetical protein